MKKILLTLLASASFASVGFAQTLPPLIDEDGKIDTDVTLQSGQSYRISGYTYVTNGATLTIEPGVTVYADEGEGSSAAVLVVTRGSMIDAQGTAAEPIVFTSVRALTEDLTWSDVKLWGGIALCGNGVLNSNQAGTTNVDGIYTQNIEGMTPASGDEPLINFGGTNDADSSGTLRYVSIRNTGIAISAGNEIQGLTLGGVGSGTILDHIEIFVSGDDGIEAFGGAPRLRNVVLAFATDDSLDLDEGVRIKVQNLLVVQGLPAGGDTPDRGGEWDGTDTPVDGTPLMLAQIANATFLGRPNAVGNCAFNIRANGAVNMWNSAVVNFDKMLKIDNTTNGEQAARVANGDITFNGVAWYSNNAANTTGASLYYSASTLNLPSDPFSGTNMILTSLPFASVWAEDAMEMNLTPTGELATMSAVAVPNDGFFAQQNYIGAFPADGSNWAAGWTNLSKSGFFASAFNTAGGLWTEDPNYGWVYWYQGGAPGYIYFLEYDAFAYVYQENANGLWMYLYK